ncbi:MAG: hypothetical protein GDA40_09300, partial [Rhodobacteraceae bacterium]|nr:hypothetical protein [Paracoccaceae bacterium]
AKTLLVAKPDSQAQDRLFVKERIDHTLRAKAGLQGFGDAINATPSTNVFAVPNAVFLSSSEDVFRSGRGRPGETSDAMTPSASVSFGHCVAFAERV